MLQRILLVLLCFVSLLPQVACQSRQGVPALAPKSYQQQLQAAPEVQLIDVRTPEEYSEGHLPGSQNMNYNVPDFGDMVSQLDKAKPVYVYCRSGARSAKAATMLQEKGFKEVYNLKGGILSWGDAGLPVVKP